MSRPDVQPLADRFMRFERECLQHEGFIYARLSRFVATQDELLDIARQSPQHPVPNLFFAAIHFLLLQGADHPLRAHYPSVSDGAVGTDDIEDMFLDFCSAHRTQIEELLATRLVQTNEVRRCACLLPAFARVAEYGEPLALVEVGTAAGLLLAWDRYRYRYSSSTQGDLVVGGPEARLELTCALEGDDLPALTLPEVATRTGIDLSPVDLDSPDDCLWLRALVWPDQPERAQRLENAMAITRDVPIRRVAGDATRTLLPILEAIPQEHTACVLHSSTLNQFTSEQRDQFHALLRHASARRPICCIGAHGLRLTLTMYANGRSEEHDLADYDSHGRWLKWKSR